MMWRWKVIMTISVLLKVFSKIFKIRFIKTVALKTAVLSIAMLSATVSANTQVCPGKDATTPTDIFITENIDPEMVIDSRTGLAWARCVVGQQWNPSTQQCTGEALRLTWKEALQAASSYQAANKDNWRVPNIKELVSIVERQCVDPAANLAIFANSPSEHYWSSTPNTAATKKLEAWAVAFYNGRIDSNDKQSDFYVRMVRYAE